MTRSGTTKPASWIATARCAPRDDKSPIYHSRRFHLLGLIRPDQIGFGWIFLQQRLTHGREVPAIVPVVVFELRLARQECRLRALAHLSSGGQPARFDRRDSRLRRLAPTRLRGGRARPCARIYCALVRFSPTFAPTLTHIQRTPHTQPRLLHHVRVDLRGLHVLVPQQLLHRPDSRSSSCRTSALLNTVGILSRARARWKSISPRSTCSPSCMKNTSAFNACFCVDGSARCPTASAERNAATSSPRAAAGERGATNSANRLAHPR